MEFKGTPAPWVIDFGGSKGHIKSTAFLENGSERTPTVARYDIFSKAIPKRATEEKYNALLISKAPEMLEMLKEMVKELEFHGFHSSKTTNEARELIKEATTL